MKPPSQSNRFAGCRQVLWLVDRIEVGHSWSPGTLAGAPSERHSFEVAKPLNWEALLVEGHEPFKIAQRIFRRLPSDPRCKLCLNPFGGLVGRACSVFGASAFSQEPEPLPVLLRPLATRWHRDRHRRGVRRRPLFDGPGRAVERHGLCTAVERVLRRGHPRADRQRRHRGQAHRRRGDGSVHPGRGRTGLPPQGRACHDSAWERCHRAPARRGRKRRHRLRRQCGSGDRVGLHRTRWTQSTSVPASRPMRHPARSCSPRPCIRSSRSNTPAAARIGWRSAAGNSRSTWWCCPLRPRSGRPAGPTPSVARSGQRLCERRHSALAILGP